MRTRIACAIKRTNVRSAFPVSSPPPPRRRAGWGGKQRATLHSTSSRASKRGTSLLEVVIAMSVAAAMLASSLGVIHMLLHAERTATKNIVYDMSLNRLSRALRSDVHASRDIEIVPADETRGRRLQLQKNDGAAVITYEVSPGSISRIVQSGDTVLEREQFRLPQAATVTVERLPNPDRVLLGLVLPRNSARATTAVTKDGDAGLRSRSVHIEAVAARDYRFVPAGGEPQ